MPPPTLAPTPTPVYLPTPTTQTDLGYVWPEGYDIFGPGGLGGDCVSNPAPLFTSHITDLSKVSGLTRSGTVQGGDLKPHGYLHNDPAITEVPVYAPVDSHLIGYAYYDESGDNIYTFGFQVSCEVVYYFDHLRSVVDRIGEVTSDTPAADSRGGAIRPPMFIEAGDLIGYTGGTPMSKTWDFGVLNTGAWNDLPPVDTYDYSPNVDKYRFAVCQHGYFDAPMKA